MRRYCTMNSYTYNDVVDTFKGTQCKLLTTKEEFDSATILTKASCVKLRIVSECSHDNTVVFKNFKYRKAGYVCNQCRRSKLATVLKNKTNHNCYLEREIDFTRKFQTFISNTFDSIQTNEGCESDIIIKPKNISQDKWLRIQIKLTEDICQYDQVYRFSFRYTYKDHILLLHCVKKRHVLDNTK